jgi:DNA polymerase III sliding clamp (beta) subunit (PCNA family)
VKTPDSVSTRASEKLSPKSITFFSYYSTWIAAQVEEEGTTTLPAKLLAELVNALAAESVELVKPIDTHTVQVSTGGTHASLRGLAPDEFPLIPTKCFQREVAE